MFIINWITAYEYDIFLKIQTIPKQKNLIYFHIILCNFDIHTIFIHHRIKLLSLNRV